MLLLRCGRIFWYSGFYGSLTKLWVDVSLYWLLIAGVLESLFWEFILSDPKLKLEKTLATPHRYNKNEKNDHQIHTILYNPTDRASNIAREPSDPATPKLRCDPQEIADRPHLGSRLRIRESRANSLDVCHLADGEHAALAGVRWYVANDVVHSTISFTHVQDQFFPEISTHL